MPNLNILLKQHDDYLEVLVTGTYDVEEAIDRFPSILSVCRLTGLTKVLIDCRALGGIPRATEKILYAFGIQEQYATHMSTGGQALMVAYLGSPPVVSTYEPGIEIAEREGLPFKLFTVAEEAYGWLGVSVA